MVDTVPRASDNEPPLTRGASASLFGRDAELADIHRFLTVDRVRLVTLTGAGGIGKTRLAHAVAEATAPTLGASACFVDLSVLQHPAEVAASVAQALGALEAGSRPVLDIARDVVTRAPLLLVLDGFERVVGAASLIGDLLAVAPRLVCLVTSREPLRLRAEQVWPVAPLSVPPAGTTDVAAISGSASVALFVHVARARQLNFDLTPANAIAVAELCRRLDGLPLAIELAAAQVAVMTPLAILARLEARQPLVVAGARDAPARHQSLRAALAWSYDLLEPAEQVAFRQAGVFMGCFSPEALAALLPPSGDVLATAAALVQKSLVQVCPEQSSGEVTSPIPRFRLLETTRAFALDRLQEHGELSAARRRHAAHFIRLAESLAPSLIGPDAGDALDRLEREYDNFRAVLHWALEGGDLESGLRLAGALHRFWLLRGHLADARAWLERALSNSNGVRPDVRAAAFNAAGTLAGMQGDHLAAQAFFECSLELWRAVGNNLRVAAAIGNLGLVAHDRGDLERAVTCFADAEELYAASGDRRGMAIAIGSRARVIRQAGDTAAAVPLFEEALALFRDVGDPRGIANALANLGYALVVLRQHERALWYLREALQVRHSLRDVLGVAECLEGFAAVAAGRGRPRRAARLVAAAAALHELTGAPLSATDLLAVQDVVTRINRQLSAAVRERETAAGRSMALDEMVEFALRHDSGESTASTAGQHQRGAVPLSPRERQVAVLVARGWTNQQIAESLRLARRTIETHLEHIFAKLGAQARAEVAVWVTREDLEVEEATATRTP